MEEWLIFVASWCSSVRPPHTPSLGTSVLRHQRKLHVTLIDYWFQGVCSHLFDHVCFWPYSCKLFPKLETVASHVPVEWICLHPNSRSLCLCYFVTFDLLTGGHCFSTTGVCPSVKRIRAQATFTVHNLSVDKYVSLTVRFDKIKYVISCLGVIVFTFLQFNNLLK